jgi:hypothetical protein
MNRVSFFRSIPAVTLVFIACFSDITVRGQDKSETVSPHYVLPDFVKGSVKMKNGKTIGAIMNYNKVSEEMIFDKDGQRLAMDNLQTIDTVFLGSMKFVPFEKVFHEVLVNDRISLFMQHKCNLVPPGKPAGYGGTSETSATSTISVLVSSGMLYKLELPGEYRVSDVSQFWIIKDKLPVRIAGERQILKTFPEKSKEIEQYIKQNKLNLRKQADMIELINKCNDLYR